MKNENFVKRLNEALDKEKFPPKNKGRIQQLAEMMGLTHRGASKWINGETCPPANKYAKLAEKLSVREKWLREGEGPMAEESGEFFQNSTDKKIIAVYALGRFLEPTKQAIKTVTCDLSFQGKAFAIKLESEAMSPRFPNGSIIILDDEKIPKDGDFILVKASAYPIPIFRQLLASGHTRYLIAHNPKFEQIRLTDEETIIGGYGPSDYIICLVMNLRHLATYKSDPCDIILRVLFICFGE